MLNKIISFASGVILVRVLSKADYGAYSYALNIINYFVLFNGLGASSCVVQLCIERGEGGGAAELVYRAASSIGMLWDVVLTVILVVAALFLPLPVEGAGGLLLFLAPLPILSLIVDLQQQRLRSMFMNREYALTTNINTLSLAAFSVGGALLGASAGLSLGRSFAMVFSSLVARLAFKVRVHVRPPRIGRLAVADILKMSVTVCLTNAVSQLLILVGTTLVGSLTGDQSAVAGYAAATTIPFALMFLPSMVMTYVTPYFIQHACDRTWVLRRWGLCTAGVGLVAIVVAAACIVGAGWIVPTVFGMQYVSSVPSFQILMAAFVIGSVLRSVSGNVLASHRKYVFNLVSSGISLAAALASTFAFVPMCGMLGAAFGYLLAMVLGSVVNVTGVLVFAGKPSKKHG